MRIWFLFLLFPPVSFSQKWTLEQCIDTALKNNTTIQKLQIESFIADVNLKTAKRNQLPSVNSGAVHGYNWGQTIDPFTNQFATNMVQYDNFYLSTSVILFSGLQNYHSIKANETGVLQSDANLEVSKRAIKMEIATAYLQVLLNQNILDVSIQNAALTQVQYDRVKNLKDVNQATQLELDEVNAQLQLNHYEITKATNDVHYSKLLLQQLMNFNYSDSFEISEYILESPDIKNISFNDSTINTLPELASIDLGIQKQLLLVKSLKGRYYPTLLLGGSLGSGYSGNNKEYFPDGGSAPVAFNRQLTENFYQSAQLTLNIPIFNKSVITNQVRISEYTLQALVVDRTKEEMQLKQKLEQLSMEITNESVQYSALTKVNESLLLNYNNFKIRFENGDATFTELAEAQNKLIQSQSNLVQSEYQLKFKATLLSFYLADDK